MSTNTQLRLRTPRLSLRAPTRADARRIAELAGDLEVARMTSQLPHPYHREDADAFLDRMEAADHARERVFVIEHGEAGAIGMLGFHPGDQLGSEIGYWIGRPYWGQGFATEAATAALAWARDGWLRRALVSGHYTDNPASGRVLEKAGFLYTGRVEPRASAARGEAAPMRMMVWLA